MSIKNKNARPANEVKKEAVKELSITFNENEAKALVQVISEAVKNRGLDDGGSLATTALYFKNKIQSPFQEKKS